MTITAVVQARMGSTRLPGKVMAPLAGVPLIEVLLQRLSQSSRISSIVLATSDDPRDQPLASHVECLGYRVFRGSEHDVLSRFYLAAASTAPDRVVRITGDCPLVDASIVDSVIEACLVPCVDYASNIAPPTYPDGLDVEVCTWSAISQAFREATAAFDREHVTPFLRVPGRFRTRNVTHAVDLSAERWTVDEPADLKVVSAVFDHFSPNLMVGWREVLDWLNAEATVKHLNQAIERNAGANRPTCPVILRRATVTDARLLHDWRNEDGMRRASFSSNPISFDSHYAWLTQTLAHEGRWLFIAELSDQTPIGYVRFDEVDGTAEISVTVDVNHRGRGLGPALIRAAVHSLAATRADLTPVAIVKSGNVASLKTFQHSGFVEVATRSIDGINAVELRHPASTKKDWS